MLSRSAEIELEYMWLNAPKRGGYMYEAARPAFESGEYQNAVLQELLDAGAIRPHPDPMNGWVPVASIRGR